MLAFIAVGTQAQNIIKSPERTAPGQGKVTIYQDPKIKALTNVERPSVGKQKALKAAGFRMQTCVSNNTRGAKNDAYRVAFRIKKYFPELAIYASLNPPHWLCRVGSLWSIGEADAITCKLKATGVFKEVSIVKNQINIPL